MLPIRCAVLAGVGMAIMAACSPQSAPSPSLTWESERVTALNAKWLAVFRSVPENGDPKSDRRDVWATKAIIDVLDKEFTDQEVREVIGSLETMEEKITGLQEVLIEALLCTSLHRGDGSAAISLLAIRGPEYSMTMRTDIEYLVVTQAVGIEDPYLLFFEAYAKARTPRVKTALAAAVRRSVAKLDLAKIDDDGELMDAAKKWYVTNRKHLEVDMRYAVFGRMASWPGAEYSGPLFIPNP